MLPRHHQWLVFTFDRIHPPKIFFSPFKKIYWLPWKEFLRKKKSVVLKPWIVLLSGNHVLLCCFLCTVIHFLPPSLSSTFSLGCSCRPGARPQPRMCPRQLLPGNGGPAGWTREEPEGLIHVRHEEEGALLHCQSPAGEFGCVILSGVDISQIYITIRGTQEHYSHSHGCANLKVWGRHAS